MERLQNGHKQNRATQDLGLIVKIPIKPINKLSNKLDKRDMLIPAEITLDNILEDRAHIPINAIHMHSGFKADLYSVRDGDNRLLGLNVRKPPAFVEYMDTLDTMYAKDGNF